MTPSIRCTVRIDEDFFKKLEAKAKKEGKSRNQIMSDLMEKGFKYIDDAYRFETVKKLLVEVMWAFVIRFHERER